jgi:hypothetical protein
MSSESKRRPGEGAALKSHAEEKSTMTTYTPDTTHEQDRDISEATAPQDDAPTCPRCEENLSCCAHLPRSWRRGFAHPSYLTYARSRAAQEREAPPS